MKKVILIGFATSGKSSVGKLLAEKHDAKFVDTDLEIECDCGMTVQQIFEAYGEQYFRQKENELMKTLVGQSNVVIACGGGSVAADSFERLVQDGTVVWLTATAPTVKSRLGSPPRPLFDGLDEAEIAARIDERAPLYRRFAHVEVPTDNLTPEQVVERIDK